VPEQVLRDLAPVQTFQPSAESRKRRKYHCLQQTGGHQEGLSRGGIWDKSV